MLHIISQSPLDYAVLQRIDMGDAVMFIENAVLGLLHQGRYNEPLSLLLKKARLHALQSDLEVRGIATEQLITGITVVDYSGFVELTIQNKVIHSWC